MMHVDTGTYIALPILTAVATALVNELVRRARKELPRRLKRRRRLRTMPSFAPSSPAELGRLGRRRMAPAAYQEIHSRCVFGGVHQHFKMIRRSIHDPGYGVVRFSRNWSRSASGRWRVDPRLAIRRAHPPRRCQFPAEPGSAFYASYEAERDAAVEAWRTLEAAKRAAEERKDRGFGHDDYGFLSQDLWARRS